ncbi:MAG TPA: STAS domain-containing protein [Victivallales bacterium]|nr:STAS domain-containing protein [Victivallales bacterium]
MKKANIMIARDNEGYTIKVEGRATFECSPPLKNFSNSISSELIKNIYIDLGECTWMDSTFMGMLAIIGLKAKNFNVHVEILNSSKKNLDLLKELGIDTLFIFNNNLDPNENKWDYLPDGASDISQTVLSAHEALIEIDESNTPKFSKVVELIKEDIKKKEKNKSN